MSGRTKTGTRIGALALAASLVLSLAACSNDPLTSQYRAGDNKGYIAGDFATYEYTDADRPAAVKYSGTLDTGKKVTNADYAGKVTVVNFWYAACAPCRQEAAQLEKAYQSFEGQDVAFLGVNTYDQPETAQAFAKAHDVTYPSIIDVNGGKSATLAFGKVGVPLSATPTTIVLGKDGRPTARIIGELQSATILESLIRTALGDKS